jgi:hypothetical protein
MEVISLLQQLRDSNDLGVTMEVTSGGVVTPLSVVRPCDVEVPPRGPSICVEVRT